MVLRCLSSVYVLLGRDRKGQGQKKQPVADDPGLANFVRQAMVWQCVFNLLHVWVRQREWPPGEPWHVSSGTGVFVTLAKFSLMGHSWLKCRKGWKGW